MRARDLVKANIAYHYTLNQDVWDGDELRVDVRYKLLEIAKRFIEYLEVPEFVLVDVILRGSLVNYNYTQYSDFDLHLVTDYKALDCDITEQFYMAKKRIWNDEHDITIKGHEVELYVEDIDAKNISEGTYSVLDSRWLRIPEYRKPSIDDAAVNAKARDLMTQINRAIKSGSVEDITRLQDKIKTARQAGLDKAGEFSTENLAFKIVRNKGYLDKLYKNKTQKFDQELSIDESAESYSVRTDSGLEFKVNDKDHAVNKARSLLSYKKANKVYILKNGKAIYSWTLGTKLEPITEDVKSKAVLAALVAALNGTPAQGDYYCNPETTQAHPNQTQNAITIMRGISNVQNFERAGMNIEAFGEAVKLFKNIQKMPNKDCVLPLVKDQIPAQSNAFPADSINEKLLACEKDSWQLHETRGNVEFRKSSIFDQSVAVKSQQAPGILNKLSSFLDAKAVAPAQPWGSSDTPFISTGPLARALPKLRHAHLTRDNCVFYSVDGSNPTVVKLYGLFNHAESGMGTPANIKRQKSLAQTLSHQRI